MYIADTANSRIRSVSTTGIISTFAGMDTRGVYSGYSGDNGPATSATMTLSYGITGDTNGNIYFSAWSEAKIRKISVSTGIVTCYAGTGIIGYSSTHEGIAATSAWLAYPTSLATDSIGNLYIADTGNDRIRKVTASTGLITTIVGGGTKYYVEAPATSAGLKYVDSLWVDSVGRVYFTDPTACNIRVLGTNGNVTIVGGMNGVQAPVTNGAAATSSYVGYPTRITGDTAGNIYFIDLNSDKIYKISTAGIISQAVGSGSSNYGMGYVATSTSIGNPYG
jgi:hypothetical protein